MPIVKYYIYKITNLINHKCYVGKTSDIKRRWKEHCKDSSNKYISNAIRKYGKENFSFEIVKVIQFLYVPDKKDINQYVNLREIYFIKKFNSFAYSKNGHGYNCTLGGDGFSSEEARDHSNEMVKNGTHPFLGGEVSRRTNKKRVDDGTHHFIGGKIVEETQRKLVESGDHHRKLSSRTIVSEVKSLYKILSMKQPKGVHMKSNEWLNQKLQELTEIYHGSF